MRVSSKLIKVIKSVSKRKSADSKEKIGQIRMEKSIKQRDNLSPPLFIIVTNELIKNTRMKTN